MIFVIRNSIKDLVLIASNTTYIRLSRQVSIYQTRCTSSHTTGPSSARMLGLGKATSRRDKKYDNVNRTRVKALTRADMIDINHTDWSSVYDAAGSYNPNLIPLEIRMGRPRHNRLGDIPPSDKGNVELLKIPNFFHLTPPAIKKHCESLKEYCSPWPKDVGNRKVRITTINHLYSGPSIRHPESRKVKLEVYLKDMELHEHAHQKFILLVGDRYNSHNDELTLITEKCPTRKQNKEYAFYLLTALYYESTKIELWEEESIGMTEEEINEVVEKIRTELYPNYYKEKMRHRRHYRVINGKLIRFNRYGHPFVYEMQRYGIKGGLNDKEFKIAKEEWDKIQKVLPDTSTFDPVYKSSFGSEFSLV